MKRARFMPSGMLAIAADSWGVDFDCVQAAAAPFETCGDFAVVAIAGPLVQHIAPPSLFAPAWDSYEAISARVDAALESSAPALLLKISSPGGQVAGCFELADTIRQKAAARSKRVVSYVDGMAASAAYALACAADKIFVPATGIVGSIGCMQVAADVTAADRAMGLGFEMFASGARKADGNPHIAMSDGARAAIQGAVDDMASTFFRNVGRARGMSPDAVAALDAAIFVGAKGVAAGLADEVKSFAEVIANGGQINAQINAQEGAEAVMDEEEKKARAALKAIAEGDDEKAAARAKKALAAYDDESSDDDKEKAKAEDESDSEDKKEEDKDEKKDEAKADDEKKETEAKASGSPLALASTVQSLVAWKADREEKEERTKLMASRPDFAPEVVAFLDSQPIEVVRDAVKKLERGKSRGQVAAARAAIGVSPAEATRSDEENRLPEDEAHKLDVQMGLAKPAQAIRHEGNRMFLGVMTPAEARAEIARRKQAGGSR